MGDQFAVENWPLVSVFDLWSYISSTKRAMISCYRRSCLQQTVNNIRLLKSVKVITSNHTNRLSTNTSMYKYTHDVVVATAMTSR